jgi:hypothetical protein
MALNDVTFVKGQGGLGRPLAGEDHISGFVFYLPSETTVAGFTAGTIKTFYSIDGLEALGIKSDSTETFTKVVWYHVSEYFRIQPKGVLHVGLFTTPGTFADVTTLQNEALGKIRQVAVYNTANFSATDVAALQTVANNLAANHKPLSVLYAANVSALSALEAIDLSESTASNVSVVIGEDGAALGKTLATAASYSITCIGAALGAVSRAKVSENIGWVKNFNMAGIELDTIAFADGTLYKNVDAGKLDTLNNNHFIFLRKHVGINGSYFNDTFTAVSETSDYSTIENNRTIDKAIRNVRAFLLPELNGPLYVTSDGKLSEDTIAYFKSLSGRPLEQMQRDGELSAFGVEIDPTQDILATSTLNISVKLIPVGVARQIKVNIGFTVKLS